MTCLQACTGKSYEVCSDTEAGALAGSGTDAGAHHIQNGENRGSDDTQGDDLIHGQLVARDEDGRDGHEQTLNQVLDETVHDFRHRVHYLYILSKDFSSGDTCVFLSKEHLQLFNRTI